MLDIKLNEYLGWLTVSQSNIYVRLFSFLFTDIHDLCEWESVCECALYKIYISRDFYEWRLWQLDQMEQLTSKNQKLWTSERYRSRVLNSLYSYLQKSIIFIYHLMPKQNQYHSHYNFILPYKEISKFHEHPSIKLQ